MRAAWAALLVMLLDSWSSGFSNLEKPFTFRTGSVKSHPTSPIWAHDPILTTERRLWRGVLEQAYADAELPLGVEAEDELFIDQDRARRFLRADTVYEEEGLKLVCDFADVPFDRVVLWAKKRYALAA